VGNPYPNPSKPVPQPQQTRTPKHGYGFAGVGVRVGLGNPGVTRAIPYAQLVLPETPFLKNLSHSFGLTWEIQMIRWDKAEHESGSITGTHG